MPTLNIRLSPEDAAIVKRLRREGKNVSQIARDALRSAAAGQRKNRKTAAQLIAEIHARHPAPPDAQPLGIDTTDRRAVSEYIRQRLTTKRERSGNDLDRHKRPRRNRRSTT